jgi:hypothetical protein
MTPRAGGSIRICSSVRTVNATKIERTESDGRWPWAAAAMSGPAAFDTACDSGSLAASGGYDRE